MCFSAKSSLIAFWILVVLAVLLWYRNQAYDRVLAAFVFALGLIQLIEYGIWSGASPSQAGKALFLTLWLQVLILAIGVFIYLKTALAGASLVLFAVVFLVALFYVFAGKANFSAAPGASGHIEWYRNGGFLLGNWGYLYLLGLFRPFVLLLAHYHWQNIGLMVLIAYGLLSIAYISYKYPPQAFGSAWCFVSIIFVFLIWIVNLVPSAKNDAPSAGHTVTPIA